MPQGLIKFIVANHITYKLQFQKKKVQGCKWIQENK